MNLSKHGFTALHRAAKNGHPDACEVLLKNNANVNAEAIVSILKKWKMYVYVYIGKHLIYFYLNLLLNGLTALHCAASNGHPDTCEVLLMNNAEVNAETKVIIKVIQT